MCPMRVLTLVKRLLEMPDVHAPVQVWHAGQYWAIASVVPEREDTVALMLGPVEAPPCP
jgi:hypothetical protein